MNINGAMHVRQWRTFGYVESLGEELAKHVATKGYDLVLIRSKSQTMPEDIYCRCDIYVDIPDDKQATLFALKYNKALPLKRGQRDNEYW